MCMVVLKNRHGSLGLEFWQKNLAWHFGFWHGISARYFGIKFHAESVGTFFHAKIPSQSFGTLPNESAWKVISADRCIDPKWQSFCGKLLLKKLWNFFEKFYFKHFNKFWLPPNLTLSGIFGLVSLLVSDFFSISKETYYTAHWITFKTLVFYAKLGSRLFCKLFCLIIP